MAEVTKSLSERIASDPDYYGQIGDNGSTARVRKLNGELRAQKAGVCLHRAQVFTKVYKENEAADRFTKKSKAVAETLRTITPKYFDGELIVGLQSNKPKSHPLHPEIESTWVVEEGGLTALRERTYNPFWSTPEEEKVFDEEIYPYWKDRTIIKHWRATFPEEYQKVMDGTGFADPSFMLCVYGSHLTLDWKAIINEGTNSYIEYSKQRIEELKTMDELENIEKIQFYQGVIRVFEGVEAFAHNWADHMRKLAAEETDPAKKAEKLNIADICDRVPMYPARTFQEGLQSLWFTMCTIANDSSGFLISLGKVDDYMYPLYMQDLNSGLLTKESAFELLECFYIKLNNLQFFTDLATAHFFAGNAIMLNIITGGIDKYGNDAANELSDVLIDACISVRNIQPDMCARVNVKTSEHFMNKILDLVEAGMGFPKIYNDAVAINTLLQYGFSQQDCNEYITSGCEEIGKQGWWAWGPGQFINFALGVDLAFTDGIKRSTVDNKMCGERISVSTGDPRNFKTYEEFENAVKAHIAEQLRLTYLSSQYCIEAYKSYPLIFQSAATHSGLERGLAFHEGGCWSSAYPGYVGEGVPDLGNSLAAVKKLVYEDKVITMDQLCKALDANFEGYEDIYQMCMAVPKYGNDDDYVDKIEQEIFNWIAEETKSRPGILAKYDPDQGTARIRHQPGMALVPLSGHVPYGTNVGALPSGRKACEPLGDSCAAYPGTDVSGPTAALKSVGKVNWAAQHGQITNMYITRDVLQDAEGRKRVIGMLRTAFDAGVGQLQFNIMDKDVLVDAQKNPEKYPSLIVRVTGYSAYFVDLDTAIQDYILKRTQFEV